MTSDKKAELNKHQFFAIPRTPLPDNWREQWELLQQEKQAEERAREQARAAKRRRIGGPTAGLGISCIPRRREG